LQALAAGIALTVPLLSACASLPTGLRLDDIVSVEEPPHAGREELLRRELGVDHAPDGSWNGCFVRGWGEGC
jgi:hypothetical protein